MIRNWAVISEQESGVQVRLYPAHHNGTFAGVELTVSVSIKAVNVALGLVLGPVPFSGQFSSIDKPIAVCIIFGH